MCLPYRILSENRLSFLSVGEAKSWNKQILYTPHFRLTLVANLKVTHDDKSLDYLDLLINVTVSL